MNEGQKMNETSKRHILYCNNCQNFQYESAEKPFPYHVELAFANILLSILSLL